ncbi:ABC transporter ATP-binding protein [Bacillus chungangensis]|uniref:ABC-2 type transport system ATP-binding protein n=1 Tax=Bacillus chungangensis TaxID=587633 RepID=A0ABT9WTK2_9BACI|nr:ABC transporter ATP-binding protein [Bacillus chungangensis]MDQ0176636.1 ABC-2 type transport system ATP-binding protein [Bacillus chungangensis]
MDNVITVENLNKSYQSKKAVDSISFTVKQGEILGFLGPNGAGKSTTLNILATVLSPDSGKVTILGHDLRKDVKRIKKSIGIVPQDLAIYEEISAEKNVRFFAGLYGIHGKQLESQVKTALELVGLYDKRNEKPKTFSGGMKRRLNIACGVAHHPHLIIMDEPTIGIDPQSRNHILESIKILKENGATIIYSTHYMEEVEAIADRVIIMNDGKMIASGTQEELNKKVKNEIIYSFKVKKQQDFEKSSFGHIAGIKYVEVFSDTITITVDMNNDYLNEIIALILSKGCKIENMSSVKASLETVFLELTGKTLRD